MKCNLKPRYLILVSLVLSVTFLAGRTEALAQSKHLTDWSIEFRSDKSPGSSDIALGEFYVLRNATLGKLLGYGQREYGINLIWDAPLPVDDGNIRFESPEGEGKLMQGQPVALFVRNGGYLYYKEREYGINLEFSTSPKYEWQVLVPRDHRTKPAQLGTMVALYNTEIKAFVVYCEREYGINLRWAKDCK